MIVDAEKEIIMNGRRSGIDGLSKESGSWGLLLHYGVFLPFLLDIVDLC
jgi:hypothetical protein